MQCACAIGHMWPAPLYNVFPHYLTKGIIFERNKLLNIKCVFRFSLRLLSGAFSILRSNERYTSITVSVSWRSRRVPYRYSCQILIKLEFSRHIFEKNTQMPNLMKIRPVTAQMYLVVTDEQTHMKKLTVAVHNFANAPKNLNRGAGVNSSNESL
jgi:hypothetical protein